ncbi:uncharacterized protein LY89DRAFT_688861 [Mollisia scopiformis]|uniref:Uncharacterized protein n=1 Tax=Mollisia scopiformis TaxID=149040 RepID=A0A194WUP5_MOLSC|nr:uncharacterized protein LY89DRAFT_688861 [Mollisia scopiformis]KUJ11686.1 hypothetical protein LY89DRAFT_688861 [Mollisia scopiformis]
MPPALCPGRHEIDDVALDASPSENLLMRLPIEIRIDIYKYMIMNPNGSSYHTTAYSFSAERGYSFYTVNNACPSLYDLSILRTSRKTRKEVLEVFYENNIFCIAPFRNHRYSGSGYEPTGLLSFGNIQHLCLDLWHTSKYDADNETTMFYNMVNIIAHMSDFLTMKSITLIINASTFTRDLFVEGLPSSKLGFEASK